MTVWGDERRFRCAALCPVQARLGPFAMSGFPPLLGGMADVEQRISSRYLRRRLPQHVIRNDGVRGSNPFCGTTSLCNPELVWNGTEAYFRAIGGREKGRLGSRSRHTPEATVTSGLPNAIPRTKDRLGPGCCFPSGRCGVTRGWLLNQPS